MAETLVPSFFESVPGLKLQPRHHSGERATSKLHSQPPNEDKAAVGP